MEKEKNIRLYKMKKTLRNILTAGATMGLVSMLPMKKAEAQDTTNVRSSLLPQCQPLEYSTLQDAQRILRIRNPGFISILPDGYKTSLGISSQLRALAGLYAGTAQIRRENNQYLISGTYSQIRNPEALISVLREADTNCDKIITREEERAQTRRMLGA